MFDHEPRPPHSVLKMMRDMYSTRATASIFYTNDECVVCDIIIRQLSDLPADDKVRILYRFARLYFLTVPCPPLHLHVKFNVRRGMTEQNCGVDMSFFQTIKFYKFLFRSN